MVWSQDASLWPHSVNLYSVASILYNLSPPAGAGGEAGPVQNVANKWPNEKAWL